MNYNDFFEFVSLSSFQILIGYAFLSLFLFVSLGRNRQNFENTILTSFFVGFFIDSIFKELSALTSKNIFNNNIFIVLSTIVLAYVLGMIFTSRHLEKILDIFRIRQSVQKNVWAELMSTDKSMKMRIKMKNGSIYYGYVHYINQTEPFIALAAYKINDGPYMVKNDNKILLINITDMEYAEIIYYPGSEKTVRIKDFTSLVRNSVPESEQA